MRRAVGRDDTLSRSFMCLGFAAAVLIIGVQVMETSEKMPADRAIPASAVATSSPIQTLSKPEEFANSAFTTTLNADDRDGQSSALLAKNGLAATLESVVAPATQFYQSKLVIDLSDRQLHLHQDGAVVATYAIAVGQSGWETPTGTFSVLNMQTNPIWQHPFTQEVFPAGTDNPLGSRWIGFWTDGLHQIGLHGTNQEDLIGQAVSHGCIRMRETDIQALYAQVTLDMPVIVQP